MLFAIAFFAADAATLSFVFDAGWSADGCQPPLSALPDMLLGCFRQPLVFSILASLDIFATLYTPI